MFSIPRCLLTSYWLLVVARGSTIVHDILVHHFFIARFNDPVAPWSLNNGRTVFLCLYGKCECICHLLLYKTFKGKTWQQATAHFLEHICVFLTNDSVVKFGYNEIGQEMHHFGQMETLVYL
jgi:hypothetical protein